MLIGLIDVSGVFALSAGITLWSAWLMAESGTRCRRGSSRVAPASRLREALEGLALMVREHDLRVASALFCLQTFTRGCFTVFSVVIAIDILARAKPASAFSRRRWAARCSGRSRRRC